MEFGIEKCALLVMKSDKRHLSDGIKVPNQDKIRTLAENETLWILGADTIKQVEMKKTMFKKNISGKLENYPRQSFPAETLTKE